MKTNNSNFSCWWLFFVGLVSGFLFSVQKTENRFFEISNRIKKITTSSRKSAKKHPESHLGLFSNDLALSEEKSSVSCLVLLVWNSYRKQRFRLFRLFRVRELVGRSSSASELHHRTRLGGERGRHRPSSQQRTARKALQNRQHLNYNSIAENSPLLPPSPRSSQQPQEPPPSCHPPPRSTTDNLQTPNRRRHELLISLTPIHK